jgi:twitching motility protein PilU
VPAIDGKTRKAVIEIMLNTPLASDFIRKGDIHKLKELMKNSTEQGMQTFDQALYNFYASGDISYENAINYADSSNEVRLMIKLGDAKVKSSSKDDDDDDGMELIDNYDG